LFIGSTAIFVWFAWLIASGLMREPFSVGTFHVLVLAAFIALWYLIVIRVVLWRLCGVEELLVQHGKLHWTRKALFWVRRSEIPTQSITSVEAVTPWHGLSNHVEVTALGKRKSIGDMLLNEEAVKLAQQLRHAVGLA